MANFDWTEEHIARLRELHAEGLSFSQIGAELGCTRNAAIGKAARIGLAKRGDAAKAPRTKTPRTRRRNPFSPIPTAPDFPPCTPELIELADTPTNPVTFAELQSHHCRWPIGDPQSPDFVFCGADKVEGHSYCGRHCAVAYTKSKNMPQHVRERAHFYHMKTKKPMVQTISDAAFDEDAA